MLEKYIEQITAPATIFRRAGEGQGATVDPLKGIIEGCAPRQSRRNPN